MTSSKCLSKDASVNISSKSIVWKSWTYNAGVSQRSFLLHSVHQNQTPILDVLGGPLVLVSQHRTTRDVSFLQ